MKFVTLLGATGSIGVSTLDVLRHNRDRYCVFALTANTQIELLAKQCLEFNPRYAVILSEDLVPSLKELLKSYSCDTEILVGQQALIDVASSGDTDIVMAAIVGAAGLAPTMAAVNAGKKVLLANKEALVMSGGLFTEAVKTANAELLPVDSEHNAIFQCLPEGYTSLSEAGVSRLLLTGSGGPFRELPIESFSSITVKQACAHPNWSMGAKISVDSATMMNKGLEFIEACWLFNAKPDDIEIVIHPQSVVHSMVEYLDGSVIAQMGRPDMKTPIAHALAWPERIKSNVAPIDFSKLANLSFEAPDEKRFPCLGLARAAICSGGDYPAALNASNEVAVARFLEGKAKFTDIIEVNQELMASWNKSEPVSIEDVIEADLKARSKAEQLFSNRL